MTSPKINQWLTFIANVGVLLGLVLVAYELRQNSELMQVQISQARADSAMLSNEQLFNSPYMPAIWAKVQKGDELSEEEWIRYVAFFRSWNRSQDNVLQQHKSGMLGDNTPRSLDFFVRDMIGRNEIQRRAWEATNGGYTDEYNEFVEKILDEIDNER